MIQLVASPNMGANHRDVPAIGNPVVLQTNADRRPRLVLDLFIQDALTTKSDALVTLIRAGDLPRICLL